MRRAILKALQAGGVLLVAATLVRADEWTKKFALTGAPELRVDTDDGDVEVRVGESTRIEARVETVGWRLSPEEVRVLERQAGDRVELEIKIPHWQGNGGHRSVRVDLTVPREGNFQIHTKDGDIGAGRFDRLSLKTGDGNIEAEVGESSQMAADWSVRTGDGDLTLRLPEGFAADLDVHTGDGHVDLDFPVIAGSLCEGSVRGKMNGGGPTLTVHTGDGSIRVAKL